MTDDGASGPTFAVTVIVCTFGTLEWQRLAERAVDSAKNQARTIAVHLPDGSLAEARNRGLAQVDTEFVIHLDADDTLEPGYVQQMALGSADIRVPRVRIMRQGRGLYREPIMPWVSHCAAAGRHPGEGCDASCLVYGNWCVVGSCARTELLREIGGWNSDIPIYEDWELWLRCYQADASFEALPDAIYRQHISRNSRNHIGEAFDDRFQWHDRIVKSVLGYNPMSSDSHV